MCKENDCPYTIRYFEYMCRTNAELFKMYKELAEKQNA